MRVKRRQGERLVYYRSTADTKFWEGYWGNITRENFAEAAKGNLFWLRKPFLKYLPKSGKILEAGCGPGYVVLALQKMGYNIEGVEWSNEIVEAVKKVMPEVAIRAGDVTAMPVADGFYDAIISLGVVEHRQAGPEPFLKESFRILKPGGTLLISVPHFSAVRRMRYSKSVEGTPAGTQFYQHAFAPEEFARFLTDCGFQIIERTGYEVWDALTEDFPSLSVLTKIPLAGRRLPGLLNRSWFLSKQLGHMMLFIAKRP